jgi:hypothetical protein
MVMVDWISPGESPADRGRRHEKASLLNHLINQNLHKQSQIFILDGANMLDKSPISSFRFLSGETLNFMAIGITLF